MNATSAAVLRTGDVFLSLDVRVQVLGRRERWIDPFGREMFRYWCKRLDTGASGWMCFGPDAFVLAGQEPTP